MLKNNFPFYYVVKQDAPWLVAQFFQQNSISWATFEESRLNSIFYWCAHWDTLLRSSLSVSVVNIGPRLTEKNDVPSAKSLTYDLKALVKSFIYTKNKRFKNWVLRSTGFNLWPVQWLSIKKNSLISVA